MDRQLKQEIRAKTSGANAVLERNPFRARGFSDRTIDALIAFRLDAPERLLFMTHEAVKDIPGIGHAELSEISRYRSRFEKR
jgi:hypothetical protein